MESQNINKQ